MTTASKSHASKSSQPAKRRSPASHPDAIQQLMQDHKEVKALFKQYEKLAKANAAGRERQAVAEEICLQLTVHTAIEEEFFYPAAREVLSDKDDKLVDEATVEHAGAKELIAQIQGMSPDEHLYDAKVKVLGEMIDHHVEEEESDFFPKTRRAKIDVEGLGIAMAERKEALLGQAARHAPRH